MSDKTSKSHSSKAKKTSTNGDYHSTHSQATFPKCQKDVKTQPQKQEASPSSKRSVASSESERSDAKSQGTLRTRATVTFRDGISDTRSCSDKGSKSGAKSNASLTFREAPKAESRMSVDSKTSATKSEDTRPSFGYKTTSTKSFDSKSTRTRTRTATETPLSTLRSTRRSDTPMKGSVAKALVAKSSLVPSTKTSMTQTRRPRVLRKGFSEGYRQVAPTAYAFFVRSYFNEFRKKNPSEKLPFITLSRRCADKWHSLPNPIKQEFFRMAERASNCLKAHRIALAQKAATRFYPPKYRDRPSVSTRSVATSVKSRKSAKSGKSSSTKPSSRSTQTNAYSQNKTNAKTNASNNKNNQASAKKPRGRPRRTLVANNYHPWHVGQRQFWRTKSQ